MAGRLSDKCAVVVGAGQTPGETIGNGRAIACLFAAEGARVVCVDRDLERAQETVDLIAEKGGTAFAVAADITGEAACEHLIKESTKSLGRIDGLVNNVGIGAGDRKADQLTEDVWDLLLNVNLKGMWLTVKHALPVMREQGGSIVNISSMAAVAGSNITAYEISKAGVNRLTTNIAAANAKFGVRCNALMLGLMDTPMAIEGLAQATGKSTAEVREMRNALVPLGRKMGTSEDSANAALFLASDEARFITGAVLPVDGGIGLGSSR